MVSEAFVSESGEYRAPAGDEIFIVIFYFIFSYYLPRPTFYAQKKPKAGVKGPGEIICNKI
jgi:hypothetical protein